MEPKFLDAQTKDGKLRLTAFSDYLTDLIEDIRDWISDNNIPKRMIWYADIFNANTLEHLCTIEFGEDEEMFLAQPTKKVYPFGRRRPLRYLLHLY